MAHHDERPALRWLQRIAFIGGVACLVWVAVGSLRAEIYGRQQRQVLEQQRAAAASSGTVSAVPPSNAARGDVLGLLEIPRLGFSGIVVHGDDDAILDVAIGHLPDTPLPWQAGNSAMAGHRDGQFRPLKDIRVGDTITLATRHGTLRYVLRETTIVTPDDLSVLAPTDTRTLTLITCYPLSYIGSAPKRFILKAEALEAPGARAPARP
jgi:sortase A